MNSVAFNVSPDGYRHHGRSRRIYGLYAVVGKGGKSGDLNEPL